MLKPYNILEKQLKKKSRRVGVKVLTQWKGTVAEDATWEDLEDLQKKFLDLVGKIL